MQRIKNIGVAVFTVQSLPDAFGRGNETYFSGYHGLFSIQQVVDGSALPNISLRPFWAEPGAPCVRVRLRRRCLSAPGAPAKVPPRGTMLWDGAPPAAQGSSQIPRKVEPTSVLGLGRQAALGEPSG